MSRENIRVRESYGMQEVLEEVCSANGIRLLTDMSPIGNLAKYRIIFFRDLNVIITLTGTTERHMEKFLQHEFGVLMKGGDPLYGRDD